MKYTKTLISKSSLINFDVQLSKLKEQDLPSALKNFSDDHLFPWLTRNKSYEINKLERFSVHTVVQVHRTYRVTIERLDPFHAEVVES